jgi:hypothetical protein
MVVQPSVARYTTKNYRVSERKMDFLFTSASFKKFNPSVAEKNGVPFFPWLCSG